MEPEEKDNSVIRQMRSELDSLKASVKEERDARAQAEAKVAELESAQKGDFERLQTRADNLLKERDALKAQIGELEPFKARSEQIDQRFQGLYEKSLSQVPDGVRAKVEQLTASQTDPVARFDALGVALSLVPATESTATPTGLPPAAVAPGHAPTDGGEKPGVRPQIDLKELAANPGRWAFGAVPDHPTQRTS